MSDFKGSASDEASFGTVLARDAYSLDDLPQNEAPRLARWGEESPRGPMSHQDLKNWDLGDILGLMWSSHGSSLGMQVSDNMACIVQNHR